MTPSIDTHVPTLVPPKADDAAAAPHQPAPSPRRLRPVWPLLLLVAGALTVLTVWTLGEARTLEESIDTAQVPSAHDSHLSIQLGEREPAAAAQAQMDPWAQAQLREREPAAVAQAQMDPWAQAQLREREPATEQSRDG